MDDFYYDYYSDTLETYVRLVVTFVDYDIETGKPDVEWEAWDEGRDDVRDQLSTDEEDACEKIIYKYVNSV
jgi:hypothetical protein